MKQVNLLPYALQQKKVIQKVVVALAISFVLGAGVVGGSYASLSLFSKSLGGTAAVEEPVAPVATPTKADEGAYTVRVTELNKLSASEVDWQKAFDLTAGLAGKDLPLSAYAVEVSGAGVNLKTVGEAPSNVTFASYLEALRGDSRVSSVKVDNYVYMPEKGTVTFSLSISVKPEQVRYSSTTSGL